MDLHLKNKVIIVTGGAKGIGEAIVKLLAEEGAIPVIIGRKESDNLKVVHALKQLGLQVGQVEAELSEPAACKSAVAMVLATYGRIDGLVNNAGVNDSISLASGTYDEFISSLHKNVVHYILMAQESLPALKASKGVILNIGSKVAETGQGGTSGYAASNGARNALTREWAVELLPFGIRVNALIVAECFTPLYQTWINSLENPEAKLQAITAKIPLGNRMTTAEELAQTAVFLLSDRSSHTTGQLIHVDGGYVHLDRAINKD
jgi:L-fucose dehydrogenase